MSGARSTDVVRGCEALSQMSGEIHLCLEVVTKKMERNRTSGSKVHVHHSRPFRLSILHWQVLITALLYVLGLKRTTGYHDWEGSPPLTFQYELNHGVETILHISIHMYHRPMPIDIEAEHSLDPLHAGW